MKTAARRQVIVDYLKKHSSCTIVELCTEFKLSRESIRRDLAELENEGIITRILGGAIYRGTGASSLVSFKLRMVAKAESKQRIAELCRSLIEDGDSLALDSSTTSVYIARILPAFNKLAIITNGASCSEELHQYSNIKLIVTGGELDRNMMCYSGLSVLKVLNNYSVDKAFVSCTGISLEMGITDADETESAIRRKMFDIAKKKILILDSTKFDNSRMYKIMELKDIDSLVCDKKPDRKWLDYFSSVGINVYY